MSRLTVLAATIVFLVLAAPASSQTAEELAANHIEALGGIEKIDAIKTLQMTGTVTRSMGSRSFVSELTLYIKSPGMVRTEMIIRGMELVQSFDGAKAWGIMPFRGNSEPSELDPVQTQALIRRADFAGPLANAKKNGAKIELVGKISFEGTKVYQLNITNADGQRFTSYLDSEYLLELKRVSYRTLPDGSVAETVILFSDFKPVAGVLMAHSWSSAGSSGIGRGEPGARRSSRGQSGTASVTTIQKIEVNGDIDDAIFKMPDQ